MECGTSNNVTTSASKFDFYVDGWRQIVMSERDEINNRLSLLNLFAGEINYVHKPFKRVYIIIILCV